MESRMAITPQELRDLKREKHHLKAIAEIRLDELIGILAIYEEDDYCPIVDIIRHRAQALQEDIDQLDR